MADPAHQYEPLKNRANVFLAVLAAVVAIYFGRGFLLPILLAVFLAILLYPAVHQLRRFFVPEPIAAALVVVGFVIFIIGAFYGLSSQVQDWADRLPRLTAELRFRLHAVQEALEQMRDFAQQVKEMTEGETGGNGGDAQEQKPSGPNVLEALFETVRSALVTLLTTLVLVYFLMAQGSSIPGRLFEAMPDEFYNDGGDAVGKKLRQQIATYLRTFTLVNVGLGVTVWLSMWALGLPNPVLWGVTAGVLNFLPYVGPLITLVVIGTVSLLTFNTWTGILLPPLVFIGLNGLEGSVITPQLLAKSMTLNPIVIFVSVLFWTWAWGPVGALVAVPTLAVLRLTTEHVTPMRPLRPLLS